MMDMTTPDIASPRTLFLGQLRRDYCILPDGRVLLDQPGGSVLYAAVGMRIWEADPPPGIVARVGEDYPSEWLEQFQRRGLDVRGVHRLPEALDLRTFYAYADRHTRMEDDPLPHFARLGQTFPPQLIGYRAHRRSLDSRTQLGQLSLRQADLPPAYLDATAAHLCPTDYLTQTLIPAVLRQAGFTTVTLDPAVGMMSPVFWDDIPAVLSGLTAFLPSEAEIRALFHGRSSDLWEMAAALAAYGCDFVVIKRGEAGQLLYDSTNRQRWEVPAYPSRLADVAGSGDAFCGGFMAGLRQTFDPVLSVLYGSIASSLVVEGSGPFYALDALPGLAQARLEALKDSIRRL